MEFILDERGNRTCRQQKPIKYIVNNNCWECISHCKMNSGYLQFGRNKRKISMHRYVYEIYHGEIPKDMVIMHICDNRICINPEHLKLGTYKDNSDDKINKGRGLNILKEKELLEIKKQLIENKLKLWEIAEIFNVSRQLISHIKNGNNKTYYKILGGSLKDWI